jgi:hypothetical protein
MKLKLRSLLLRSLLLLALICLAGASLSNTDAQQTSASGSITSAYTDTSGKGCRTIEYHKETGDIVQICPGVAGYKLQVEEGDARMSVTVVAPGGRKSALSYWNVITHGFSSLGDKAEWRIRQVKGKSVPLALIVRVNASENPEAPEKTTSYLAVAKITRQKTCVTDKIGPSAQANEEARRAADSAATRPCLEDSLPE